MAETERLQEDLKAVNLREQTWRSEAVRAKAESLAAGKFVDAETALALVGDLSQFTTDSGIDATKLTARLDQLAHQDAEELVGRDRVVCRDGG